MAKRVNKRFLVALTAVVLIGGVSAMLAAYVLPRVFKKNPEELVKESERLEREYLESVAQGKPDRAKGEAAVNKYRDAAMSDQKDAKRRVGLGDMYYRHLILDPQQYPALARRSWEDALVLEPRNTEAMNRLLDMTWEIAEAQPRREAFTAVQDAANRLLQVDPGNAVAQARKHIAIIRQAQANTLAKPEEVEESVAALRELAAKDPADAKLPLWAAQGEIYLAAQALRRGVTGRAEAKRRVDAVEQSLPGMLKGQEANPEMQFYVGQIYRQMPSLDAAMRSGPTTQPTGSPAGKYTDRVTAAFAAARQHAKPPKADTTPDERDLFYEIQLSNVQWLAQLGKSDESRALLEELAAAHGDEPRVRLAYATQFRQEPARRAKIIEMLARPVPAAGYVGIDALNLKQRETALRFEVANLRLAALEGQADAAARKKVIDEVDAEVRQLEQTVSSTSVAMLEIKGRLHLVQGRFADAIPLLEQAVVARRETRDVDTLQVMLQLADAYSRQGLTGQAEKLLGEAVEKFPGYMPARVMRIQALIQDGRKSEAREQIAELKKLAPKAPEIAALEANVEGGQKLSALVEQMPETTSAERLRKAMNLRAEAKFDEAIALAEQTVKDEPKNLQAVQLLLDLYLRAERREDALAAVNAAIKANPENEQLKKWPDVLVKRAPEEYEQWALEQIKQDPDVVSREVKLYQYHMTKAAAAAQRGDDEGRKREAAEAEVHLAAAERTKPDDKLLPVRRFEFLVAQQRFEEAEKVVRRLASDNADQVQGQLFRYNLAMAKARAAGGNAAVQAGAYAEAEAAALEMTKQRPQFDTGWQCLGAVMQVRGRHRDAVQYFNNALERRGRNYEALRGLVEAQYALGDPAAAKAVLVRARESFPRDAALRELLLVHEVNHGGDLAKVAAEREQILKEQPANANNAAALAETYDRLASAPGADKDKARQKEWTARFRALLEDGRKRWPADARFVLPLAQAMLRDGDFIGGEKLVKEFGAQPGVAEKPASDLLLADYYARANKPALAEQSLRDALAKSNGSPEIKQDLARLLAATNRPAEAVKELEGVPGAAAARLRVQSLLASGKPREADQALTDALAADPANVDLSNFQIELLITANRIAEAEPLVQQRIARSDADDQARYYGALVKLRRQPSDVPGAVKDLTDLAERNPRSLQVLTLLAETRAASNDLSGAIDDLERALRLAPLSRELRLKMIEWSGAAGRWEAVRKLATDSAAHPELGKDPAWNRALAQANAATGNFAEAEKAISRAIAMVPPEQAGDLQREQLAVLHQAKNYPRVLQITGDMLAKGRKEWWIYQFRGMAKVGAKDKTAFQEFDAALASVDPEKQFVPAQTVIRTIATMAGVDEALKRIAKWEETSPRWRLVAAELCFGKGDYAAALTHLQPLEADAEKLPPEVRAPFYRAIAQSYHQMRPKPDYDKAIDAYQRYLKLQPGDIESLNNLAYILAEEISPARPQDAKQYSKVAYEIARGWRASDAKGRIYDTHGWVLVLNGESDLDEGIRVLRQAVDDFPILEAHYHLGEAELRKNRGAEATEQFNAALAMIEKSKKAKQPYDETLEPRIRRGLQSAKALDAAAAAGGR